MNEIKLKNAIEKMKEGMSEFWGEITLNQNEDAMHDEEGKLTDYGYAWWSLKKIGARVIDDLETCHLIAKSIDFYLKDNSKEEQEK